MKNHLPAQSWLWPDHVIGKRESRALRDEHNALVNSHADLLERLRGALLYFDGPPFIALHGDMPAKLTRVSIAKAEGRTP